jgi:hypothetical protein
MRNFRRGGRLGIGQNLNWNRGFQAHFVPSVFSVVSLYRTTLQLRLNAKDPTWVMVSSSADWPEFRPLMPQDGHINLLTLRIRIN